MKRKFSRRLVLHTETLRNLEGTDLRRAAGGLTPIHTECLPCPSGVYSNCQTWCPPCPTVFITCLGPPRNC